MVAALMAAMMMVATAAPAFASAREGETDTQCKGGNPHCKEVTYNGSGRGGLRGLLGELGQGAALVQGVGSGPQLGPALRRVVRRRQDQRGLQLPGLPDRAGQGRQAGAHLDRRRA